MLSKKELKKEYEACLNDFSIRKTHIDHLPLMRKAKHNLHVATILEMLCREENRKKLGIDWAEPYHDWVIIASYYAMYQAACSALANIGLAATTHGAAVIALDYKFCVNGLHRKYVKIIEKAKFCRDDVQKMHDAMNERRAAQYKINKAYGAQQSRQVLDEAKKFVNKIDNIISNA